MCNYKVTYLECQQKNYWEYPPPPFVIPKERSDGGIWVLADSFSGAVRGDRDSSRKNRARNDNVVSPIIQDCTPKGHPKRLSTMLHSTRISTNQIGRAH